jgi:hypothetical protein
VERLNLQVAWIAILLGLVSGTLIGLYFAREDWLGGYASWRRRMIRLGHVSLIGTGLLNVAFALSVRFLDLHARIGTASRLLIVGAATMPLVCFLAAWRTGLRRLFFVPVLSLLGGVVAFVVGGLLP